MNADRKFAFQNLKWSYIESREMTTQSKEPIFNGLESADVHCSSCDNRWHAQAFKGSSLEKVLSNICVTCPNCGTSEMIPTSEVSRA